MDNKNERDEIMELIEDDEGVRIDWNEFTESD